MDIFGTIPIPRDIPLPLPLDRVLLQAILVLLFLAHIVFVNLMVGGSLLTLAAEVIGRRRPDFDTLAHEISATVTVNKSLAVVLGVGPLLGINVLYTVYFYSANALTGNAWIMIVPIVATGFLITYAHKYSWERLAGAKLLHIAIGATGALCFLFVPLIFLANINLMLFPDRWTQVRGFWSSLLLPNALPRYLHFLLACLALSSLFLLGWFTRAGYPVEAKFRHLDRRTLRRIFYGVACAATLGQVFAGPLVLFTLPWHGVSTPLIVVIVIGVVLAATMLALLYWEVMFSGERIGRFFVPIVALLMLVGTCMGYARHLYREEALVDHRHQMARQTETFAWASSAAGHREAAGIERENLPLGQRVFRDSCSACHAVDHVLVGPPITEIARLYRGDPAGIVAWTKAPFKKRQGFPAMPALQFPQERLRAVAEYMLELATAATAPEGSER